METTGSGQQMVIIISFSFVNTDLRNAFRGHFPGATWILIDTKKALADERICNREDHFYKGASSAEASGSDGGGGSTTGGSEADEQNSEWEFKPVEFPHIVLDGRDRVEDNAKRILENIDECRKKV